MAQGMGGIGFNCRGRLGAFHLAMAFEVPATGVTALFGPSGCGKTTVLRCIAGLERMEGTIHAGEEIWQDTQKSHFVAPWQRNLGYVFQEANLFPHLSVRDNLAFGLRRRKLVSGTGEAPMIAAMANSLEITHLLDREPEKLSGGERQRVAIGRSLITRPRLLLMDEPLAALDRRMKRDILRLLSSIVAELSVPVIYVSHDIAEVSSLADRMIVMENGSLSAQGTPGELLERIDLQTATGKFEAGSLLEARIVSHDSAYGLTSIDHGGQMLNIPMVPDAPGRMIRVRIRARDVTIATTRPLGLSTRNVLEGVIMTIVEEKDTPFAETVIDLGQARLRARITRKAVHELALKPGERVWALVKSVSFDRRI
ncbi:MAG: molybdenum ABC transporter ATP-binding protein [Rhizobiaceae bacterium]